MVQVTIETTGTMLVGTDIAAADRDRRRARRAGASASTAPPARKEMAEHVRHLGAELARA